MKYIRTKDGVYEIDRYFEPRDYYWVKQDYENQPIGSDEIIEQADTIEELCDRFPAIFSDEEEPICYKRLLDVKYKDWKELFGAIWTSKGLIYVAKANDKGELELL